MHTLMLCIQAHRHINVHRVIVLSLHMLQFGGIGILTFRASGPGKASLALCERS